MTFTWSAADLARIARLPPAGVLLMIQCFFDDSGTHDRSRCVVWGGVAGRIEQFASLETEWLALLKDPLGNKPPLRKFGLADCWNAREEFEGYNRADSDHLIYCFRNIITRSGVVPLAYAADATAWEKHVTGLMMDLFGTAESASYGYCAKIALQISEENDDSISIVFDQGRKSPILEVLYDRACDLIPEGAKRATQSFANVEATPGLQAADMVATSFYWHALDLMKDPNAKPNAHLARLLEGSPMTTFGMFREPEIIDLVAKMRAKNPWLYSR